MLTVPAILLAALLACPPGTVLASSSAVAAEPGKAPPHSVSPLLAGPPTAASQGTAPGSPTASDLSGLVSASLIADSLSIQPGGSVRVGLRLTMKPGWHTYWQAPGDSGLPTTLDWTLADGLAAAPLEWPAPQRFIVGDLANFGYEGEAVLLTQIRAASDLQPGSDAVLKATASWLVCQEICVPGQADLSLTLAVSRMAPTPDPEGKARLDAAAAALPLPAPWPVTFATGTRTLVLHFPASDADHVKSALFLPTTAGAIDDAGPQILGEDGSGRTLTLPRTAAMATAPALLEGVLDLDEDTGGSLTHIALAVSAKAGGSPPAEGIAWGILVQALGLALLGGLVLNLMPCVFPVLSIKIVGIAQQVRFDRRAVRLQGWAYTGGVLSSFAALGVLIGLLKLGGQEIGWGFQLQSPVFVAGLAYVMLALGLSMSGLVTVGGTLMGAGGSAANLPGAAGTFFSGVLATVVATPCTAPFMGAALGYALTQSFAVQLLVLLTLGLGLALPYLTLSHLPGLARLMPRPGRWMVILKQVLAVPLYATVAWLVWVLSLETGRVGLVAAVAGLALVALAALAIGRAGTRPPRSRPSLRNGAMAAVAVALLLLVLPGTDRAGAMTSDAPLLPEGTEAFSEERLASLIESKQPVFIDYTAAWCITCLVNERTTLANDTVRAAFAGKQVAVLRADWTRQNVEITRSLEKYGRNGVPLYLLYGRGSNAPIVLPQILTPASLVEAVGRL